MDESYFKEQSLSIFREQIIKDYNNYSTHGYPILLTIIGEIVRLSQEVEMELAEQVKKIAKMEINEQISFNRMGSKELVNLLNKYGFFDDVEANLKEQQTRKLKDVIECRNYVVHECFNEWRNKKHDNSKLFQLLAKSTFLFRGNPNPFHIAQGKYFKTGGFNELIQNISNNWTGEVNVIDFNKEVYDISDPSISAKTDWIACKIIMTKHLLHEFLDRLHKNPLSIYA